VLGTRVSCAKKDKPIEMPFEGLTHVGPSDGVTVGRIHLLLRGVTRRLCDLSSGFFDHLLLLLTSLSLSLSLVIVHFVIVRVWSIFPL